MGEREEIRKFADAVAERIAVGGGEPEDLLRGPFENLLEQTAMASGITNLVLTGEYRLAVDRIRPDYAAHIAGALIGFIELKAPGTGVDPILFKARNKKQWERMACLPNVLYSDGQEFALFRNGEQVGSAVRIRGDITKEEQAVHVETSSLGSLGSLLGEFLNWKPVSPRTPKQLADSMARLCRVLRAEVSESLEDESSRLHDLATDWRILLYPDASEDEFANGYAQTVAFALLLARIEDIDLEGSLLDISKELGSKHTLMAKALAILTDPDALPKLAVSVETLRRVLSAVNWPILSGSNPTAWLYFYEYFLDAYDSGLRQKTGSYYTPVEAVDPMVRLVDELLIERLDQPKGFVSNEVTVVDPALGTGTFLFRIIDRIADRIENDEGPAAVGPQLRDAAKRLIGFELQAGPYSVAELRLSTEFKRLGAELGPDDLRVYLTDTLSDPYIEEVYLPASYRPIATSRKQANEVKKSEPVMVVIGNPPYKDKSRRAGGWVESGSPNMASEAPLEDFKPAKSLGVGAHVKHLYNLYAYFWRWAFWKVFENNPADKGVVAFVTLSSFLNGPGFAGMRAHMRRTADEIWIIDCTPEGHQPDVATRIFKGVQQPVCITIALRDGPGSPEEAAKVRYVAAWGNHDKKYEFLRDVTIDKTAWESCPDDWHAPFLPAGADRWSSYPALDDLLAWSGSGTMPGRTWVVGTDPAILKSRWNHLIGAAPEYQPTLLREHKDRTMSTRLSDNLAGFETKGALKDEAGASDEPVRYGVRTLDRGWIIPDKRVINRPNPSLWQIRNAPGQLFLTAPDSESPSGGPSATFSSVLPDLHHYAGRGGRTYPIWLDEAGTIPNVNPGVLDFLSNLFGIDVRPEDVFAYMAAILAFPGYEREFVEDLVTPGLRIPLTSDPVLFSKAIEIGSRVLWLHSYGERFVDLDKDRPKGPPRVAGEKRPQVVKQISDRPEHMPEFAEHDDRNDVLRIGTGEISGVTAEMFEYEVSNYKIVRRWVGKRKREPDGKNSDGLEAIIATSWKPERTTELIDLLNVVALLIALEPAQEDLLVLIIEGPCVSVPDLQSAKVLPITKHLSAQKPPRQATL